MLAILHTLVNVLRFIQVVHPWFTDTRLQEVWACKPRADRRQHLRLAWQWANRRRVKAVVLPVLGNRQDAPCDRCTGLCCTSAAGFNALHVYRYEAFARYFAEWLIPNQSMIGDYTLRFVNDRCPLLQADGRCGAYDQRPVACRAFNCLEGAQSDYHNPSRASLRYWSDIQRNLEKLGCRTSRVSHSISFAQWRYDHSQRAKKTA